MLIWQANAETVALMHDIKIKNHHPRIETANIALAFNDSKAFTKNRFNWGKTTKFSKLSQLWQGQKYDFCITLSSDAWIDVLSNNQRAALLDLHLSRCSVQFIPETVEENGKKIKVKDEKGFIKFTDQIKTEDDGTPVWEVLPLDLNVFSSNIKRYGTWTDDIVGIKQAINEHGE
jgi:hypothetical protein